MKRMLALCALLAVLTGCTYAAVAGRQEAESYDLYFREKDLTAAAGGDALRAEQIYLPADISREDTARMAENLGKYRLILNTAPERLLTILLKIRLGKTLCQGSWRRRFQPLTTS